MNCNPIVPFTSKIEQTNEDTEKKEKSHLPLQFTAVKSLQSQIGI